jgi:hypothetical protein
MTLADAQRRAAENSSRQAVRDDAAINFGYSSSPHGGCASTSRRKPNAPRDWLLDVAFPTLGQR